MKSPDRFSIEEIKKTVNLGALAAARKARMYGTKLVVQRNGKVELETPDEFESRLPKDVR